MDTKTRKLLELAVFTTQQMQQVLESFSDGLQAILDETEAPKPIQIEVPQPCEAPKPVSLLGDMLTTPVTHINLSQKERLILLLLMEGQPNKVIAKNAGIAEATVKVHVKAVLRRLRLMNRTQAAVWARTNHAALTSVPNGNIIPPLPDHSASVEL